MQIIKLCSPPTEGEKEEGKGKKGKVYREEEMRKGEKGKKAEGEEKGKREKGGQKGEKGRKREEKGEKGERVKGCLCVSIFKYLFIFGLRSRVNYRIPYIFRESGQLFSTNCILDIQDYYFLCIYP